LIIKAFLFYELFFIAGADILKSLPLEGKVSAEG
jgi:hypothetical protein